MDVVKKLRDEGKWGEAARTLAELLPSFEASYEWTRIAFFVGDMAAGQFHITVNELAHKQADRGLTARNATYYCAKLAAEEAVPLAAKGAKPKFVSLNPTLAATAQPGGGWLCILRTVNFRQRGAVHYEADPEFGGLLLTTNYLLRLDAALRVVAEAEIQDPAQVVSEVRHCGQGMEDMRVYVAGAEIHAVFTLVNCRDRHPEARAIGHVKLTEGGKTSEIEELPSPLGARCEKNWLPFEFRGARAFLYSYDPVTVLDHRGRVILQRHCPFNCSGFRGSAGPVPYEDGFLVVVHSCGFFDEGRVYYHRFVRYDADFGFVDVSAPFIFDHRGVEFCSGMTPHERGFLLGVGIEDREARLLVVSREEIARLWLNFPARLDRYLLGE